MLFHHSTQDYNTAATSAAREARAKMEGIIDRGRQSAMAVWEKVHNEVPADQIAKGGAVGWHFADPKPAELDADDPAAAGMDGTDTAGLPPGVADILANAEPAPEPQKVIEHEPSPDVIPPLVAEIADQTVTIHNNALGQIATRAGIPAKYLRELIASPNPDLRAAALHLLETHYRKTDAAGRRYLCRSVDGDLRGFLSDRFRRLDSRPLLETFAEACQTVGAVPVDGTCSDVRVALKAYLPTIFEPVENEPLLIGLQWHNSDFGAGRHALAVTILRLWCTNKAIGEDCIKQSHLGGRLDEDIAYSQRTYELDTEANQSALKDTVEHFFGQAAIDKLCGQIKTANEQEKDWSQFRATMRNLTKAEQTAAQLAFEGDDVINLPPGRTAWRASNALSWIAGQTENPDRKLDLERAAGKLVKLAA